MPLKKFLEIQKDERRRLSLSLIVTNNCNLNCTYCYENNVERKEDQMDFAVAKEAIEYYLSRDDGHENVAVEFFGGEPLLAFPLIREITEWFYSKAWKKHAFFSLVTNGTILPSEMKDWLAKYSKDFTVAFTIDGCKKAHDLNRCNSYDSVYSNLPFFKKYWPYQPTKMTINDKTIPYISESVIHLEELEIDFNGGIVLEDIWGDPGNKKELLKVYEDQLAILIDFYDKRPHLNAPAPLFPVFPEFLGNPGAEPDEPPPEHSRFCGAGHEMVTIDVDGSIHACHRFLPICTGRPAAEQPVNWQTEWKPAKCAKCKFIYSCPTCAGFNYEMNGDSGVRTTFHCEAFKLGLLATCKLEALKIEKMKRTEFEKLPEQEKDKYRRRLAVILDIIENGLQEFPSET